MTPNIDTIERIKIIGARMRAGQDTYAGRQAGWHQLGNVIGQFATWKEMLTKAGASFEVVKKQLQFAGINVEAWGTFRRDKELVKGAESRGIRVRNQAGEVSYLTFLGSVGEDYQIIQHTEGFELLDELVGQIDGAHYETMGTLDFGKLVWGQVDPNLDIRVGDDVTKVYLTFHTSHDGSKAFDIFETGVREVCRNTFRLGALKKLAATLRVKHTKNAQKRIDNLKTEIQEIRSVAMTMQERLNYLAAKKVTRDSMTRIMDRLFPKKQTEEGEQSSTRRDNIISDILSVYEDNDGNQFPEQRGTAYNLLNAFTNYTDHMRVSRGGNRALSAMLGSGDKLKTDAMSAILLEAKDMPLVQVRGESIPADSLGLQVR